MQKTTNGCGRIVQNNKWVCRSKTIQANEMDLGMTPTNIRTMQNIISTTNGCGRV